MKKLLIQLDTNQRISTFDAVVAYDGGIDHLISIPYVSAENCAALIEGAIYTRAPKDKHNTAVFIGGDDMGLGEALFAAVQKMFFSSFQVSIMLDSNGSNTTAAAVVALLDKAVSIAGKRACVLAGTGPVGQRLATMLALADAQVTIGSRTLERAQQACDKIHKNFKVKASPALIQTAEQRQNALANTELVFGTGKSGICLLPEQEWRDQPKLEALADVNTCPPSGIEGIDLMDKATERYGKMTWGGIGIGAFKLKLHRLCIEKLFTSNTLQLDAKEILQLARDNV